MRARRPALRGSLGKPHFNPRAPHGGATKRASHRARRRGNFNPRARVGRDAAEDHLHDPQSISIHAPAWGATVGSLAGAWAGAISIRAPAWGATFRRDPDHVHEVNFNPRARVGRDCRG